MSCTPAVATTQGRAPIAPLLVGRRQVVAMLGSPKLVQRMVYASAHPRDRHDRWLEVVAADGRTRCTLYTRSSVELAYERLLAGECPPPLPSERGRIVGATGDVM